MTTSHQPYKYSTYRPYVPTPLEVRREANRREDDRRKAHLDELKQRSTDAIYRDDDEAQEMFHRFIDALTDSDAYFGPYPRVEVAQ